MVAAWLPWCCYHGDCAFTFTLNKVSSCPQMESEISFELLRCGSFYSWLASKNILNLSQTQTGNAAHSFPYRSPCIAAGKETQYSQQYFYAATEDLAPFPALRRHLWPGSHQAVKKRRAIANFTDKPIYNTFVRIADRSPAFPCVCFVLSVLSAASG